MIHIMKMDIGAAVQVQTVQNPQRKARNLPQGVWESGKIVERWAQPGNYPYAMMFQEISPFVSE